MILFAVSIFLSGWILSTLITGSRQVSLPPAAHSHWCHARGQPGFDQERWPHCLCAAADGTAPQIRLVPEGREGAEGPRAGRCWVLNSHSTCVSSTPLHAKHAGLWSANLTISLSLQKGCLCAEPWGQQRVQWTSSFMLANTFCVLCQPVSPPTALLWPSGEVTAVGVTQGEEDRRGRFSRQRTWWAKAEGTGTKQLMPGTIADKLP